MTHGFFKMGGRMLIKRGLVVVLLALTALSACTDEATRNHLDATSQKAVKGLDDATHPSLPPKHYNPLVVTDKVWAGNTAIKMHRGLPLPDRLESARGVTIVSAASMSLEDIAKAITEQTGMPVYLADASARGAANANVGAGGPSGPTMIVAYEGPLSGLMERVAATFGVSWRFDGSSILVKRFETHVFTIEALPGSEQVSEGMQDDTNAGGGGSSGGSGGGSSETNTITQNSKYTIDFKYWDELGQILNSMLGGTGSIVVSPSIGTVTITTTPEIMRVVADYIAQENQRLSRQIAVNVEVYTVALNEGMDFNIAFTTALKYLSNSNFNGNFTNGAAAPAEQSIFGSLQGSTVNSAGDATKSNAGVLNVAILGNALGAVTDVFSALSAIGDTTKVARFPLVTLNNRPVARRVGTDIAYLQSSSTTASATAGSGPTVTLTPGTVHQGFSVQLTPRLLDDGRILLQYSLSIIDLINLTSFSAGGSSIQEPTTANRLFVQQSVLKSGSMLVIGGAEEQDAAQNSQGVGDPFNYLLGGGSSSARTHTMVFFAITPQVLDVPHSEQE